MSIFAVTYSYGGPVEVLNEHRPAHRAYLGELAQQGKVMGSGPFTDDGAAGALLVFSAGARNPLRVKGDDMSVFCGIDWAEGHHDIALVDEEGRLVAKRRIQESVAGVAELIAMLAAAGDSAEAIL